MVKTKAVFKLFNIASVFAIITFLAAGCVPVQPLPEETPVIGIEESEPAETEAPVSEDLLTAPPYYWPWISYGHLDLSTGESILGPDSFESGLGFIAEFTEDYSFDGLLVWTVEESDVFAIEWIRLSFNVEYYEQDERLFDLYYEFTIEGLQPEPNEDGIQEFFVDRIDLQEGFEVVIKKVILGKEQQSAYKTDPIDYVALEIEMNVVDKP